MIMFHVHLTNDGSRRWWCLESTLPITPLFQYGSVSLFCSSSDESGIVLLFFFPDIMDSWCYPWYGEDTWKSVNVYERRNEGNVRSDESIRVKRNITSQHYIYICLYNLYRCWIEVIYKRIYILRKKDI